ncbi:MAG: hypothetical protein JJE21_02265 [Spirochaetaceae bacterium]|nr:hypothetical protein [Spirochaetaceae bacterium]
MKLFFARSYKLFKRVHLIITALAIITIVILFLLKGIGLSLMYGFVTYISLRIIASYLINIKDNKEFNNLLSILYDSRTPFEFLKVINAEIDYSLLDKEQTTTLLIHRANALSFSGEFDAANEILDTLEAKLNIQDSDKLLILNNKVTFSLLEKAFGERELNENIFNYSIRKLEDSDSPYINNSIQDQIIYKIINNIKLTNVEIDDLWLFIKHSGSTLNKETLYYFASIHLLHEGDRKGAIEELQQINIAGGNTVVQRGAANYLEELRENEQK